MGSVEFIDPADDRLWTVGWEPPLHTWFASHEPWPPLEDVDRVDVLGRSDREIPSPMDLVERLQDEHRVKIPVEAVWALADPAIRTSNERVQLWSADMIGRPPWHVGTESQRWDGYLDLAPHDDAVGQGVLRNRVGASDYEELRLAEDSIVAVRAATLHLHELPATLDLDGLRSILRRWPRTPGWRPAVSPSVGLVARWSDAPR